MNDAILQVDDIQKYYGNKGSLTKAVDHISFQVCKGEFLGIMGASGSGKTTLLNCISTIDTVTSGHIFVDGKDITALHGSQLADFRGKKLGFIFQDFNLLDTLNAYENISLSLSIAGVKPAEIRRKVTRISEALGICEVLDKYPYQMSGGQQQRVAAARAMVTDPAMVLADEPTGSVALVQHYPKQMPVIFPSLSTFISSMTDRQRVRFSSRVKVSYIALKSAVKIFLMAAKSGGASCAGSGSFPSAAVYIS